LIEVTSQAGLEKSNGWWNKLEIADINADGYPDVVAGNHGLNSRFKASESQPVCMYAGDFDQNGSVEQIITCYNGPKSYPMVLKHDLVSVIPALKKKYLKYESYKGQGMEDIFTKDQLQNSIKLSAYRLSSSVLLNNGTGGFRIKSLPAQAQFSPVYGIAVDDFDRDGHADILLGGNFYESKPEVGIYDASYGLMLRGDGKGDFQPIPSSVSGINIRGQIRAIVKLKSSQGELLAFGMNDGGIKILMRDLFPDGTSSATSTP
jgi:enediyne biosynthesis protein E4